MSRKPFTAFALFYILTAFLEAKSPWISWDEALEKAQKEQKLILLKAVQEGCHYCSDMEERVFSKASVKSFIQNNFIPAAVNISTQELPLGLKLSITPSFYFIKPDKRVVKFIPGSWNSEDFQSFMEKVQKEK